MKKTNLFLPLYLFLMLLLLAACGGDDVTPTAVQPASVPNSAATGELPATNDIATPIPESTPAAASTDGTPEIESGDIFTDDDFLPIEEILSEIDDEACQSAYEIKAEIEALMAAGEDLAELEEAVDELIEELENCPTPTPTPES